jgi:hypothetical protein
MTYLFGSIQIRCVRSSLSKKLVEIIGIIGSRRKRVLSLGTTCSWMNIAAFETPFLTACSSLAFCPLLPLGCVHQLAPQAVRG